MTINLRRQVAGDVLSYPLEGMMIAPPPAQQEEMGFFTDATLCIGCKACEVACKQWNMLPSDGLDWSGKSYDNSLHLGATTWRHVTFTEQAVDGGIRWLFNSDVCKRCTAAPCQEACPTGALIYNEFGNVYVQQDVCNGCGYCVAACPFGVVIEVQVTPGPEYRVIGLDVGLSAWLARLHLLGRPVALRGTNITPRTASWDDVDRYERFTVTLKPGRELKDSTTPRERI